MYQGRDIGEVTKTKHNEEGVFFNSLVDLTTIFYEKGQNTIRLGNNQITIDSFKEDITKRGLPIYCSQEALEYHQKMKTEYEKGYEDGKNGRDYLPKSKHYLEGYETGKIFRIIKEN